MYSAQPTLELGMPSRRRAPRREVFQDVAWRRAGHRRTRRGVLVGVSRTGFALVAEAEDTPRVGAVLVPSVDHPASVWRQPAVVVRTETLSGTLNLIAAEFRRPPWPGDGHGEVT